MANFRKGSDNKFKSTRNILAMWNRCIVCIKSQFVSIWWKIWTIWVWWIWRCSWIFGPIILTIGILVLLLKIDSMHMLRGIIEYIFNSWWGKNYRSLLIVKSLWKVCLGWWKEKIIFKLVKKLRIKYIRKMMMIIVYNNYRMFKIMRFLLNY